LDGWRDRSVSSGLNIDFSAAALDVTMVAARQTTVQPAVVRTFRHKFKRRA
jgi:hypothetical protein